MIPSTKFLKKSSGDFCCFAIGAALLVYGFIKAKYGDGLDPDALFQKRIKNDGIIDALIEIGLKEGDMIRIGDYELQYYE